MNVVTAGIDIGGIDTEIGVVSQEGKCFKKTTVITGDYPDVKEFIKVCAGIITTFCKEGNFKLNAIGVAAPNGNPNSASIENAVNLVWKGIIPFAKILQSHLCFSMGKV